MCGACIIYLLPVEIKAIKAGFPPGDGRSTWTPRTNVPNTPPVTVPLFLIPTLHVGAEAGHRGDEDADEDKTNYWSNSTAAQ